MADQNGSNRLTALSRTTAEADLFDANADGVYPGQEIYPTDGGGGFRKVVFTGAPGGVRRVDGPFVTAASGTAGTMQSGTGVLIAGQSAAIPATITATSRILVTRKAPPGGGTAIGILAAPLADRVVGAPGSFRVSSLAEANQALVAADVSTFDWVVVN